MTHYILKNLETGRTASVIAYTFAEAKRAAGMANCYNVQIIKQESHNIGASITRL